MSHALLEIDEAAVAAKPRGAALGGPYSAESKWNPNGTPTLKSSWLLPTNLMKSLVPATGFEPVTP